MAGEHNPYRSHLYPNLIVHPRSSRGLCSCSLSGARNKFRGLRRRFRRALGTGATVGLCRLNLLELFFARSNRLEALHYKTFARLLPIMEESTRRFFIFRLPEGNLPDFLRDLPSTNSAPRVTSRTDRRPHCRRRDPSCTSLRPAERCPARPPGTAGRRCSRDTRKPGPSSRTSRRTGPPRS